MKQPPALSDPSSAKIEEEQMAHFGIVKVPADKYLYRDWRYSKLSDALAQARRDAADKT